MVYACGLSNDFLVVLITAKRGNISMLRSLLYR